MDTAVPARSTVPRRRLRVLHAPVILGLSLALLRPFKAVLIALQYKHNILDQHD